MRTGGGIRKKHFGSARVMDESAAAAASAAAATMSTLSATAAGAAANGTIKGAYNTARENRAATLAAAEALASFPTSSSAAASSSRERPPPPSASAAAAAYSMPTSARMVAGGGIKAAVAAKKKKAIKYVKDPRAPKRFKSAFIFFTMHRHKTIRKEIADKEGGPGTGERTPNVAKIISEEWRTMKADERAKWDEKARLDRDRYEVEKSMYKGPWKVPASKKSKVKARRTDADAPKRPMSSFLSYSNSKRAALRRTNPHMANGDISKLLSTMWREAPEEEKREHIEQEERLREVYLKDMAAWRERTKKEQDGIREKREEAALRFIDKRDKGIVDDSDLHGEAWGDNYEMVTGDDGQDAPSASEAAAAAVVQNGHYYGHYQQAARPPAPEQAAPPMPPYYGYYHPAAVPYQYPPQQPPQATAADSQEVTAAAPQPPQYYNPYLYCGPPPPVQDNDTREGPPASASAPPPAAPYGQYYGYYYYGQMPQPPPQMQHSQQDGSKPAEAKPEEKGQVEES